MAPDGAAHVLHIPVQGRDVPVEVIEGRDDFILPSVLADAVKTATWKDGVAVPTWEHLVAMKAEAWFDRHGDAKTKYLEDLGMIRDELKAKGERLRRTEIRRLVAMRHSRKHEEMLRTIERVLAGIVV